MNNSLRDRLVVFLFVFWMSGCDFRPVSSALDQQVVAYRVDSSGSGLRLTTQIPVPPGTLKAGRSNFRALDYSLPQAPPGEAQAEWSRQNTWYYPQHWTSFEEFWFGWMLLDAFSIDRGNHASPLALESGGVEALFDRFGNDRFTKYYPPVDAEQVGNFLNGTGLDSVFGLFFRAWPRDTLVAARVEPGSAAWKAGLRSDDRLLRFDGRWAARSLRYLHDTAKHVPVTIEYLRPANRIVYDARITRSPHLLPSLFADTLPGAIGYISIGQFVSTAGIATDELFQVAAQWLEANSTGTWIMDLRGNGGGTIRTAQNILSALLPNGALLIRMRSREIDPQTLGGYEYSDTMRVLDTIPKRLTGRRILLLQDSGTASSSEIVISALRENLGADIRTLGDVSYGKGIGQIYEESPLGGFMAVTCLHIDPLVASSYHGIGIGPDDLLPLSDSAISKAWNLARGVVGARIMTAPRSASVDFAIMEWNRRESTKSVTDPLLPATDRRPFPVR